MHFCCYTTFVKRIPIDVAVDDYIEAHPNLPEKDKTCLKELQFEIGMLKETVRFLAGEPTKIDTIEQDNKQYIKWYYKHRDLPEKKRIRAFLFNSEGILIEIIKRK